MQFTKKKKKKKKTLVNKLYQMELELEANRWKTIISSFSLPKWGLGVQMINTNI